MIQVKKCKYGRGLFASETIPKGEVIEVSPVIVIPSHNEPIIKYTEVQPYLFVWTDRKQALALGLGSLFNHSLNFNVTYRPDVKQNTMIFTATKEIRKGSQLYINYGYNMKSVNTWRTYLRRNQKSLIRGEFK